VVEKLGAVEAKEGWRKTLHRTPAPVSFKVAITYMPIELREAAERRAQWHYNRRQTDKPIVTVWTLVELTGEASWRLEALCETGLDVPSYSDFLWRGWRETLEDVSDSTAFVDWMFKRARLSIDAQSRKDHLVDAYIVSWWQSYQEQGSMTGAHEEARRRILCTEEHELEKAKRFDIGLGLGSS